MTNQSIDFYGATILVVLDRLMALKHIELWPDEEDTTTLSQRVDEGGQRPQSIKKGDLKFERIIFPPFSVAFPRRGRAECLCPIRSPAPCNRRGCDGSTSFRSSSSLHD